MKAESVAEQDGWDLEWVSTIQRIVTGNNAHISRMYYNGTDFWLSYVGEVNLNGT